MTGTPTPPSSVPAQLRTPFVALDTEVFRGEGFNFTTNHLIRIRDAAVAGSISLLVTDVVDREVAGQIRRKVAEAATKFSNTFRKDIAILVQQPAYAALGTTVDLAAATQAALAAYAAYRAVARIEVLSTDTMAAGPILAAYFEGRPPFATGDKKSEFPDAFTVAALAAWCDAHQRECYVVSGDAGVRDACAAHPRLLPLERTAQLIDLLTANAAFEAQVTLARASFDHVRADIVDQIEQAFSRLVFDVDSDQYTDTYVDQVVAQRVRIDTADLVEVDEDVAEFECGVTVGYTAEVSYDDPEATFYDREDDTTHVFNRIAGEATSVTTITVSVRVLLDRNDPEGAQLDEARIDDQEIAVDLDDFVPHPEADDPWEDDA